MVVAVEEVVLGQRDAERVVDKGKEDVVVVDKITKRVILSLRMAHTLPLLLLRSWTT